MKNLDFQEYSTTVIDADGDEHESTVRAAVVDADTATVPNDAGNPVAREVMTPTGGRRVSVGDVLVETERPGVYDYLTADQWSASGYVSPDADKASEDDVADSDPESEDDDS